ncbi:Uma2 family endonuclease [Gloeocapsopsis dulcis]|uniref:Uma2 family endonuclease n=1 Tax=Gloeocapsopsis dulcis TaxID=2859516 RepID=UPI002B262C71|nr:Uma2 family endonuclease [Gloeocapsopsis dulcis]WNN92161.1 Uma2 family endonuclease [Gloeocapsopsis dulcis]
MIRTASKLSLQEFLDLPQSDDRYELVEGQLQPKMSPKYKHASIQGRLFRLLDDWCNDQQCGRVCPEWAIVLKRQQEDWVPVPDLTYVSYQRLPQEWDEDEPCPVKPELVVEIISPGQTFSGMTQKATDYLLAGVDCVWVVESKAQSVTIFRQDSLPQTVWQEGAISDPLLPELVLPVSRLFAKTGE